MRSPPVKPAAGGWVAVRRRRERFQAATRGRRGRHSAHRGGRCAAAHRKLCSVGESRKARMKGEAPRSARLPPFGRCLQARTALQLVLSWPQPDLGFIVILILILGFFQTYSIVYRTIHKSSRGLQILDIGILNEVGRAKVPNMKHD